MNLLPDGLVVYNSGVLFQHGSAGWLYSSQEVLPAVPQPALTLQFCPVLLPDVIFGECLAAGSWVMYKTLEAYNWNGHLLTVFHELPAAGGYNAPWRQPDKILLSLQACIPHLLPFRRKQLLPCQVLLLYCVHFHEPCLQYGWWHHSLCQSFRVMLPGQFQLPDVRLSVQQTWLLCVHYHLFL